MTTMTMQKTKEYTITRTGHTAWTVIEAEHASFYGIHGDHHSCWAARGACEDEIKDFLLNHMIDWFWFEIISAKSIDTSGTPIPYKCEIKFRVATDPA